MSFYRSQGEIETLSAKTGLTSSYHSDHRVTVYGGRGGKFDELTYLRNQNADANSVNTKLSDAWNKFTTANSIPGSRIDQQIHEFNDFGAFP